MVNYKEWDIQLVNFRTKKPIDDDSGLAIVMAAGSPSKLTIYANDKGASLSNPLTMLDGRIRFFTDISVTSVDITVLTSSGKAYFLDSVTTSQHRLDVNTEEDDHKLIVPYNMNTACGAIVDTGLDLIAGMKIKDVYLHVTTASTANGLTVGLSGATYFLSSATTTSTGFKVYEAPVVANATGSANYISSSQIKGTLLCEWSAGLTTATAGGDKGYYINKSYLVTAATSLIYMVAATNSGGTGDGYLYISYELCPTV